MKKTKKMGVLPKELVKPLGIDETLKGDAIQFLCRENNDATTCRINNDIDEGDDILF